MDIVDFMIHVHPDLSAEQRGDIEQTLGACQGVMSAHFSAQHAHELTVAYDPRTINADAIMAQVKRWDQDATKVGM